MSSWANRGIPRRRNLSQIPEPFRPQLIGRAEHPLIVQSETYQPPRPVFESTGTSESNISMPSMSWFYDPIISPYRPQNEILLPSNQNALKNSNTNTNTSGISKLSMFLPVIEKARSTAIELAVDGHSYVFVILRNIRTVKDNELWITAYNSIRRYYTNKIVIIDDNSAINTVNGRLENTETIQSEFNGAGEILPYYYFLKEKWADRMIFLHDSMLLIRPFRMDEIAVDGARFLWYFEDHTTEFTKKINTYLSVLKPHKVSTEFVANGGSSWRGCFGGACVIDRQVVETLNGTYGLFSVLPMMIRTRADRQAFERLLGIMLFADQWVLSEDTCSLFGNILKYPGAFEETGTVQTVEGLLKQKGYDSAVAKVWRGR